MLRFEVEINGERSCLAGVAEFGVLTAILSWVKTPEMIAKEGEEARKLDLHVGGLTENNGGEAHVTWLNRDLLVGDERGRYAVTIFFGNTMRNSNQKGS